MTLVSPTASINFRSALIQCKRAHAKELERLEQGLGEDVLELGVEQEGVQLGNPGGA
jgi:hypothetical protein